jgi:hypothetical protein
MNRWIAAILATFNVANGLTMLLASSTWWTAVPGAPDTGPFNAHRRSSRKRCEMLAGAVPHVLSSSPASP